MAHPLFGRATELQAISIAIGRLGRALAVSAPAGGGVSAVLSAAATQARNAGLTVVEARRAALPVQLSRMMTATAPMLVCLDDLDDYEPHVRETVALIGARVCALPVVLLVGAHREAPRGEAWTQLILPPLSDSDAERMLDAGGPLPAGLRDRIVTEAAGNPLGLCELPAPWRSSADTTGADVLMPFLPQTARLRTTMAGPFTGAGPWSRAFALAGALTGLSDEAVIRRVAELAVGERPETVPGDPVPGDPLPDPRTLVAGAVVQSASPAELRAVHGAAQRVLRDDAFHRVWHLAARADAADEALAVALEESAEQAESRLAPLSAVRRLMAAARLSGDRAGRARRLVLAGRKAYELGRPDLAEDLLRAAEQTGLAAAQQGAVGALRSRFAARVTRTGEPVEARCALAAQLIEAGRAEAALDVLVGVTQSLYWGSDRPAVQMLVLGCLLRLPQLRADPRYLVALAVVSPGDARPLVAAASAPEASPDAARLLAIAAAGTGDLVRAADLFTTAAGVLATAGRRGLLTHAQTQRAHVTMTLGDWDTAGAAAHDAMGLAERTGQPVWQLRAQAIRATVRAFRGDAAGALADCAEIDRMDARGHTLGAVLTQSRIARAVTLLGQSEWHSAYALLASLTEPTPPGYDPQTAVRCLDLLAEAAVHSGHHHDATAIAHQLEMTADPSSMLDLNLRYARALLAGDEDAERHFTTALAGTPPQWPWLLARTQLAYGAWLRRRRRIAEARTYLSAAHRTLMLAGAQAWARRAAAELRAAGVPGEPGGAAGRGLLSPQELHVAELAAQGLSNRQIGSRLMLSPRTVSSHLYRIFPKLHITSRNQLAAKLAA